MTAARPYAGLGRPRRRRGRGETGPWEQDGHASPRATTPSAPRPPRPIRDIAAATPPDQRRPVGAVRPGRRRCLPTATSCASKCRQPREIVRCAVAGQAARPPARSARSPLRSARHRPRAGGELDEAARHHRIRPVARRPCGQALAGCAGRGRASHRYYGSSQRRAPANPAAPRDACCWSRRQRWRPSTTPRIWPTAGVPARATTISTAAGPSRRDGA